MRKDEYTDDKQKWGVCAFNVLDYMMSLTGRWEDEGFINGDMRKERGL